MALSYLVKDGTVLLDEGDVVEEEKELRQTGSDGLPPSLPG